MVVSTDPTVCGRAAFASMSDHQVTPTPDNFAIWYEYHSGLNPELSHLINLLLTRPRAFNDQLLSSIYQRFFVHAKERAALQDTATRMMAVLQEVSGVVEAAGADADRNSTSLRETSQSMTADTAGLPALIARLRAEVQEMAARSARLGDHLVGAVERIQALERSLHAVQRDAATDSLTGLSNRRNFDAKLRAAAGLAMNSGEALSLAFLDIDHFKRFNDTWGHQVGDQVLRLVAATLNAQIRPSDLAARYGGEEFGVILPTTPTQDAAEVGDRIRRSFEGKRLVARNSGQTIDGLTVSIGVACYDPGEALDGWIARADKALYAAKAAGRNRVVVSAAA